MAIPLQLNYFIRPYIPLHFIEILEEIGIIIFYSFNPYYLFLFLKHNFVYLVELLLMGSKTYYITCKMYSLSIDISSKYFVSLFVSYKLVCFIIYLINILIVIVLVNYI